MTTVEKFFTYKLYLDEFRLVYTEMMESRYLGWLAAKAKSDKDELVSAINRCILADLDADKTMWKMYEGRVASLSKANADTWLEARLAAQVEMRAEYDTMMNAITPQGSRKGPQ